jgi:hypothetical protein
MKKHWLPGFLGLLLCVGLSACTLSDFLELFFPNFPAAAAAQPLQIESIAVHPTAGSGPFSASVTFNKHTQADVMTCIVTAMAQAEDTVFGPRNIGASDNQVEFDFNYSLEGEGTRLECRLKQANSVKFAMFSVVPLEQAAGAQPPAASVPPATQPPATQPQVAQPKSLLEVLKSGTYVVIVTWPDGVVKAGSRNSSWDLTVSGDQVTGISHWDCCPGVRNDPVRGTITADKVIFQRDCTGQGWTEGACSQTYTGFLDPSYNMITGPVAGTKIVAGEDWMLYLSP